MSTKKEVQENVQENIEKLNIYKKLQKARVELSNHELKKTGKAKNKSGAVMYTYFELADILPHITRICDKYGITPIYNFTLTGATLEIRDSDNVDNLIVFTMPTEVTPLVMCNAMQNIGGAQSFAKRYLYFDAFDVAENIDNGGEIPPQLEKISNVQVKVIKALIEETKTDEISFMSWAGIERIEDMTVDKLSSAMSILERKKEKKGTGK